MKITIGYVSWMSIKCYQRLMRAPQKLLAHDPTCWEYALEVIIEMMILRLYP